MNPISRPQGRLRTPVVRPEQRKVQRVAVRGPAAIEGSGGARRAWLENLSLGGARFAGTPPAGVGEDVIVQLERVDAAIRLRARLVWELGGTTPTFGVAFRARTLEGAVALENMILGAAETGDPELCDPADDRDDEDVDEDHDTARYLDDGERDDRDELDERTTVRSLDRLVLLVGGDIDGLGAVDQLEGAAHDRGYRVVRARTPLDAIAWLGAGHDRPWAIVVPPSLSSVTGAVFTAFLADEFRGVRRILVCDRASFAPMRLGGELPAETTVLWRPWQWGELDRVFNELGPG
jgi:hypothetical protein